VIISSLPSTSIAVVLTSIRHAFGDPQKNRMNQINFDNELTIVKLKVLADITALCLLALIALCLAWELWLAPLRPGGSWLMLKTIPLLFPLRGILNRRRYTFQWSSMLILGYFAEGIVRAMSDKGFSKNLAMIEITLSLLFFITAVAYAHLSRPSATAAP